jgi:CBS domain-containing protein
LLNTVCLKVRKPGASPEQETVVTKVRDVMTAEPIVLQQDQTIADAAQAMRDTAVGAVLVVDGDRLCGLITDRDIVVRAVAESALPDSPVGPLVSPDLIAVGADDEADDAARVMQAHAVRRLPVMDDGRIVGIVSIGDLAVSRGEDSALADISAAEPNQ